MTKRKQLAASSSTSDGADSELQADYCFLPGKRPLVRQEETIISPADPVRRAADCGSGSTTHRKVRKRKSRAKPKAPIKELSASRLNFREMVHQHTGLLHMSSSLSPAATIHAHEAQTSSSSACNSSHIYDFPSAVKSLMNSMSFSNGSISPHPLPSFATALDAAASEPRLMNIYPTKSPAYTDADFIKLACVLLQHIISELSSKHIMP